MSSESWVVVGIVATVWVLRELIPILARAIRGGNGGEVMSRVLAEGHGSGTSFQAPFASTQLPAQDYRPPLPSGQGDGPATTTGRYAAVGYGEPSSPAATTGRYTAPQLGPGNGSIASEHDHLVTKTEFQAFQVVVQRGLEANTAEVKELGRTVTSQLTDLTRAVGQLEGRWNGSSNKGAR